MRVIKPLNITPAMLTSNVPENDAPAWAPGTYGLKARVMRNRHVFESLTASNTAEPGAETTAPLKWLDIGANNRWRMFDKGAAQVADTTQGQRQVYMIGTETTNPNVIDFTIVPGTVVNGLALFGLSGIRVTVTLTDPTEGVVYSKVISLLDSFAMDMWEWLFKPIDRRQALALLDIPAYGTATLRVRIEASPGETARCAMAVPGYLTVLGETVYGTSVSVTDFSSKEVDDFGNESVIERGYRDRAQYDIRIDTAQAAFVKRYLTSLRAKPAVYIGDQAREETIIFGRYRELQVVLSTPAISECALDVGALI